jgi:hypothetical protein
MVSFFSNSSVAMPDHGCGFLVQVTDKTGVVVWHNDEEGSD